MYYKTLTIALCFIASIALAQPCKSDFPVITTKQAYLASVNTDSFKKMVELSQLIPSIQLNLRYATTNNFTRRRLYSNPVACLRVLPARALINAQAALQKKGLALKIWDAYRPFSVSCTMWQVTPDRHYVANPRKGSNHNRGLALDLTLVDLKTGIELDMGTGFDSFSDSASHNFTSLPPNVLANRNLLQNTMRHAGFSSLPNEWWHYSWHNDRSYEILDVNAAALLNR